VLVRKLNWLLNSKEGLRKIDFDMIKKMNSIKVNNKKERENYEKEIRWH
jgi:hypothetical protein